ncbi:unnamed protein product [Orchesella dallaii]|uniref:C2H2-type domain-containing protein n=1 Tax=Orchesella dallaii TaxID=48710 RepID=A0ABP1RY95_9HEXA
MKFSNSSDRKRHIGRKHAKNRVKPHTCPICANKFGTKFESDRHIRIIHSRERPYSCRVCKKEFTTTFNLKVHACTDRKDVEKDFVCDFCGKSFTHNFSLMAHFRIHTNEKPYECRTCAKTFVTSGERSRHVKSHTKNAKKNYICGVCGSQFYVKKDLDTHIRRHIMEKPYQCNHCEKDFVSIGERIVHLKRHHQNIFPKMKHLNKNMVHACLICGKAFTLKSVLDVHIRYHVKEKPYTCEKCLKEFATSWGRLLHDRRRHTKQQKMRDVKTGTKIKRSKSVPLKTSTVSPDLLSEPVVTPGQQNVFENETQASDPVYVEACANGIKLEPVTCSQQASEVNNEGTQNSGFHEEIAEDVNLQQDPSTSLGQIIKIEPDERIWTMEPRVVARYNESNCTLNFVREAETGNSIEPTMSPDATLYSSQTEGKQKPRLANKKLKAVSTKKETMKKRKNRKVR